MAYTIIKSITISELLWILIFLGKKFLLGNLPSIPIDRDENPSIYAFSDYSIIIKNKLSAYKNDHLSFELDLSINNPCIYSSDDYLIVGEKNGNKLYVIKNKQIVWETELEGNIENVYINKNGYAAVILSQSSYKSIVKVFNNTGKALFTSYFKSLFSNTVAISSDNKTLAISQMDISDISPVPIVKLISIEKATNKEDENLYTYKAEGSSLITDISFINNDTLICMYNNKIVTYKNENIIDTYEINLSNDIFASINLNNNILIVSKNSDNILNSSTIIKFINTTTKKETHYELFGTPHNVFAHKNVIAVNLGTEIYFINTSGWLIKKYNSTSEIKDIHLSDNFAIIEYKNKLDIINL